ncbi:methyl-accepting chemotaxis protein [Stutzerimonas nosocomialis]|uniref:Methyl-accepting chemotaxis protein n=1 Tax=Stutzerimonas nosocomialis TaxID=1056496 RepID=A0A5R9QFQ3_9GAMM|nr:methyl-accepting chemotaxis protein [Stutzerimonas nosocomialis]TLX63974.1 methyl-accepting chemotaxis protein [Stutzerimonas nosocomialis]
MKNLKVSYKLGLGFAAVLLLTLATAAIGIQGLDMLISRSDKAQTASLMLDKANDIRHAQMTFEATSDPKQVEQLDALVAEVIAMINQEKRKFTDPKDLRLLDSMAAETLNYQKSFKALVAAKGLKVATRRNWVASGDTADKLIAALEARWSGAIDNPVVHQDRETASLALQIANLSRQNRQLRFAVRGYLLDESDKSLLLLQQQFQTLRDVIDVLAQELVGSQAQSLQMIKAAAEEYIGLVEKLPPIVDTERKAHAEMGNNFENFYTAAVGIGAAQNAKRAEDAASSKLRMLGATLLALLAGVVLSAWMVRQITQPLSQAVKIAEGIGAGDMTGQPTEKRGDEFGLLLDAMSRTRNNLRDLLAQIGGITTQLAAAAEELSAVTEQTSAGVNNQRMETDQVATAMNEMAATVHEVAQNAGEASEAAQRADRQAVQGNTAVKRALTQIDKLTSEVSLSAEAMGRLNQESANISTVLTVINGIAEQTNLLALNAAIEAARAGEAGRGFAVVADEVRGLAQRTQQSTAQIETLIGSLQKGSQDASSMMQSSSALALETVDLARKVGEELEAITQTVSMIQAMNMQIATAAEEQSSVAEEVNRSVLNVRDVADQSAAAAEETAASTVELARLGNELNLLIGRFKV